MPLSPLLKLSLILKRITPLKQQNHLNNKRRAETNHLRLSLPNLSSFAQNACGYNHPICLQTLQQYWAHAKPLPFCLQ